MILFEIADEFRVLGYSLLVGILLGMIYDLTRFVRLFFAHGKNADDRQSKITDISEFCVNFVADLIFFIVSALIIAVFVFHANTGRVRGYLLIGVCAGLALYLVSLGRLTHRIECALVKLVRMIARFIKMRIFKPIITAVRLLMSKIYALTLGRAVRAMRIARLEKRRLREINELTRLCENLGELVKREVTNEITTAEYTDQAGDLLGIRLSDNHLRQRRDQVQRSGRRKSRNQ